VRATPLPPGGPDRDHSGVKAAHRAGRPLSRWYFALLIAAALISLYAAGTPLWWGDFIPFVLPIWGMLIGYWLARLIAALKLTGPAAIRRRAARWAVPPLVFLALLTAVVWDGPRLARFALSESSLRAHAQTVAAGTQSEGCRRLGLYRTCWAVPIEGGAIVGIRDLDVPVNLGLVRSEGRGFAWLPGDRPPPAGNEDHAYFRFTSDWWAWHG